MIRGIRLGDRRGPLNDALEIVVGQIDGGGIGKMDVVVAAGVETLADDPPAENRIRGECQPAGDLLRAGSSSGSPSSRRIFDTLIDMAVGQFAET